MWGRKPARKVAASPEVYHAQREKEYYEAMSSHYQTTSVGVAAARDEAKLLKERADASLARNHFGQSITEAMKRRGSA